jgi:hypothetical protein
MQHQADRRINNFKDAHTLMSPFSQANNGRMLPATKREE